MKIRKQMNDIYRDMPLEDIPWNLSEPPPLLVDAVRSGEIGPCRVVDLGCGAGNYAVWLARQGFDVTGVDISEEAIGHARELAEREGVTVRFVAADFLHDVSEIGAGFDLAVDWEVLHHIFPEDRPNYLDNVARLLRPGGRYFSVCFSDRDPAFPGEGKYRVTRLGTKLYLSSEAELRDIYLPRFEILKLETAEIPGKYGPHLANVAWLRRD